MMQRFTGYKNNQKFTKIAIGNLTKIIKQNLFYLVPFEKYWPIKLERMRLHAVQACQWLNGIMPCTGDP